GDANHLKAPALPGLFFFACASPACGRIAALAGWSQYTCKRVWLPSVACNTRCTRKPLHRWPIISPPRNTF
ncbi:hypothetical protein, partial [Xanthomonas phaseoli]